MKLQNRPGLLAVVSLTVATLFGPSHSYAATEPIRIQIGGEPSTLDPARVIDQYGFGILRNVVEGLFRLDAKGELANGLAESYTISKDNLVYRFKIRANAKWSDGKPVALEDFVNGLRHVVNPKTASPNAEDYFAIKKAKEIYQGKAKLEELGVRVEGSELVIELLRPDPTFLLSLSMPSAIPIRKDVLEANKGVWSPKDPVTGDYFVKTYRPADTIELEPNPERKQPGQLPVQYKILQEEITAMNLFEAGRMDVITTITATEIAALRSRGLVQSFPSTTVFYLAFNHSKPPFNDIDWRRAVASSLDREGLSKALMGVFEPTTSFLPKTLDGTVPYKPLDFPKSVEKVKAIDPAAKSVRLAFGASAFTKTATEKIQFDLQKKLGLRLELEPMELKTLLARLKSEPPAMYLLGVSAVYNDPMNHLESFSTESGPNFARYSSPEYEKLLDKLKVTAPGAKRTELAQEANRFLIEKDIALVPIVLRTQVFGVSKSLKNFTVSPYQVIPLAQLRK